MAYTVNFTDSVNKGSITVDDNTLNTETTLGLPGRNLSDYGALVLENFLHLLENFANNTSPVNPVEGQLWYDTTTGVDQLKVYDGTNWVAAGGLKKATSAPLAANSTIGDLWVDTSNQQVYLYSGSGWILVGPDYSEGTSTGAKFVEITSTTNKQIPCILNYAKDKVVSIISSGYTTEGEFVNSFIPKATIAGFSTIYPGTNMCTNIGGVEGKYYGTSEKAENLLIDSVKVPGSEFVRKNVENILSKALRIRNNAGIDIGETQTLLLSVTGSNAFISNRSTDGNIDLRVQSSTTALRVTPEGKIGILNPSPDNELDVTGSGSFSGTLTVGSTTDSTGTTTGAVIVAGGLGIGKALNVGSNIAAAGSITGTNILPTSTNTYNIGSNDKKYNNVYANTFRGNLIGDITGNVSGSSASSAKLNSSTTFTMTGGDVTASSFTFDGTQGTVNFEANIDPDFLTDQTAVTTAEDADEILINRPGTGLRKIAQSALVATVPTFSVGMMMPFAGTTAPAGWAICDGRILSQSTFSVLFTVIGHTYGTIHPDETASRSVPIYDALGNITGAATGASSATHFKTPDLRGRFPVGYVGNAYSAVGDPWSVSPYDVADRLRTGGVLTLGAKGGNEDITITAANLPEHMHSLQGDAGTQFFAITNVTGVSDTNTSAISIAGADVGTGLEATGGIEGGATNTPIYPAPPYQTFNYIIYHGVGV